MFVNSNGNVFSPKNAVQQSYLFTLYKEAVDSALCHFFHYCNVS